MQTTAPKSFIEVLENEIRADLRKEIEAAVAARYGSTPLATQGSTIERAPSAAIHAAGRLETWLASHVGPITFKSNKTYAKNAARPATDTAAKTDAASAPASVSVLTKLADRTFTATTAKELVAIEALNRQSPSPLSPTFTEDELKAVWRKAALKTHPDRFASADQITQIRMTVHFRELVAAYEVLLSLTVTLQSKAA